MDSISSKVSTFNPCYVRVKGSPRSFLAKAINYCYLYKEGDKTYTVYSQFLQTKEEERMKLKDIINAKEIKLKIDDDLILFSENKPKNVKNNIFIICKTNDGVLAVPKEDVKLIDEFDDQN